MMDEHMEAAASAVEPRWQHLGENRTPETVEAVEELLANERIKASGGR